MPSGGPAKEGSSEEAGGGHVEEEEEFYHMTSGGFTEDSGDDEYPEDNQTQWTSRRAKKEALKNHQTNEGPPKSSRPPKVSTAGNSQKAREEKALLWPGLQGDGSHSLKSMGQSLSAHIMFPRVQGRQGQSRRLDLCAGTGSVCHTARCSCNLITFSNVMTFEEWVP
ncbi:hypothetical protein GH733_001650 [Mirounga leonina]|nr:hypothetical protein GH733_004756 [Mirounga leonina]KAF3830782.1 hypothetical protein GH733_001650 [Mirounga leonina]